MIRWQQLGRGTAMIVSTTVVVVLALSAFRLYRSSTSGRQTAAPPHSVDLKWRPSASAVVGYSVYRSEKPGGPFTKLTSAPISGTSYTDRTVQSGHTYFYLVTAVTSEGRESRYSNLVKAVVPSP